jgi:hypothetical protein
MPVLPSLLLTELGSSTGPSLAASRNRVKLPIQRSTRIRGSSEWTLCVCICGQVPHCACSRMPAWQRGSAAQSGAVGRLVCKIEQGQAQEQCDDRQSCHTSLPRTCYAMSVRIMRPANDGSMNAPPCLHDSFVNSRAAQTLALALRGLGVQCRDAFLPGCHSVLGDVEHRARKPVQQH